MHLPLPLFLGFLIVYKSLFHLRKYKGSIRNHFFLFKFTLRDIGIKVEETDIVNTYDKNASHGRNIRLSRGLPFLDYLAEAGRFWKQLGKNCARCELQ